MALFQRPLPKPDVPVSVASGFPVLIVIAMQSRMISNTVVASRISRTSPSLSIRAPVSLRPVDGSPVAPGRS